MNVGDVLYSFHLGSSFMNESLVATSGLYSHQRMLVVVPILFFLPFVISSQLRD